MSAQRGTRGFYSLGIPVIFMRSDVVARLCPDAWNYSNMDGPETRDSLTVLHEVRHFHDCLITPFLFRRFILETQRCYIGLNFLATAHPAQLFRSIDRRELSTDLQSLMDFHEESVAEYRSSYADFEQTDEVPGIGEIDFSDVLESLAVLTEIASLIEMCGEAEARAWWLGISASLPSKYTHLIGGVLRCKDLETEVRTLGWLLMGALYSGEPPVSHFKKLMSLGTNAARVEREIVPLIESANNRAMSAENYAYVGIDDVSGDEERSDLGRIAQVAVARRTLVLPCDLRNARGSSLARMTDAKFDLLEYVRNASEFSVPPVCFFADDAAPRSTVLPFARKATLREKYGDVFSISVSRDSTQRTMISCGLLPCPGYRAFVRLNTVDTMLSTRFMSQGLFGDKVSYCPEMDKAYAGIYWSHVSSGG